MVAERELLYCSEFVFGVSQRCDIFYAYKRNQFLSSFFSQSDMYMFGLYIYWFVRCDVPNICVDSHKHTNTSVARMAVCITYVRV